MSDQSPPVDPAHTEEPDSAAAATAKDLAEQTIDAAQSLAKLAVDIPVETARLALDAAEGLVKKLRDVLPD